MDGDHATGGGGGSTQHAVGGGSCCGCTCHLRGLLLLWPLAGLAGGRLAMPCLLLGMSSTLDLGCVGGYGVLHLPAGSNEGSGEEMGVGCRENTHVGG